MRHFGPASASLNHDQHSDVVPRSFDIVKDQLGGPRRAFPHSMVMVAGTQAATARANYLALMRLSNLGQVQMLGGCEQFSIWLNLPLADCGNQTGKQ